MISIKDLKKRFGDNEVLKDIDIEIQDGEVVSLIGSSGSGKSTLLRCINLLETPTSGEIYIDGANILDKSVDLNKLRQNVGMVFQQFNLFPNMSVIENIKLAPKKIRKMSDEKATKMAMKLLRDVGLADKADAMPKQLSGGQKQRVAIARALVNRPSIILADEPTGALDTKTGEQIMELLTELNKEGKTIIMVTHEPEIAAYAKRQIVIRDGVIYSDSAQKGEA